MIYYRQSNVKHLGHPSEYRRVHVLGSVGGAHNQDSILNLRRRQTVPQGHKLCLYC